MEIAVKKVAKVFSPLVIFLHVARHHGIKSVLFYFNISNGPIAQYSPTAEVTTARLIRYIYTSLLCLPTSVVVHSCHPNFTRFKLDRCYLYTMTVTSNQRFQVGDVGFD